MKINRERLKRKDVRITSQFLELYSSKENNLHAIYATKCRQGGASFIWVYSILTFDGGIQFQFDINLHYCWYNIWFSFIISTSFKYDGDEVYFCDNCHLH